MNHARKFLLKELDRLQNNRENLKLAHEKLSKIPETNVADGAKTVISEFLANYDEDICEINAQIESVTAALSACNEKQEPITCRKDLLDLTHVEVASFMSKTHTDYYISTFKELFGDSVEPKIAKEAHKTGSMMQEYNYIYRIFVPVTFFNAYSEKLSDLRVEMEAMKHNVVDPEDGDGS